MSRYIIVSEANGRRRGKMPNKRDLRLDEYEIGVFAYRELNNFCKQYREKRKADGSWKARTKAQSSQDYLPGAGRATQPGG